MGKRHKRHIELPFDVEYHILLRLPVKTLCRLRCVSKLWRSLISDPHFQKHHSLHAQQSPLFLKMDSSSNNAFVRFTTYTKDGSRLREFPCKEAPKFCRIIQSSLPLPFLCLTEYDAMSIRLGNPSTEEITILPEHTGDEFLISVGFGFAASANQFKAVRFFTREQFDLEAHCEVFTVGTNSGWREARSPPPYRPRYDTHPPFLHGALHLLPCEDLPVQDDHYIATFDVDTEGYREIPLPEIYFHAVRSEAASKESWEFLQLVGLRGSLCLALDYARTKKALEIWFSKDYRGGNWVKQYNMDLSSLSYILAYPLMVSSCGNILLNLAVEEETGTELRWYDTEKNCLAKHEGTSCEATFYVESFLPLGSRCTGMPAKDTQRIHESCRTFLEVVVSALKVCFVSPGSYQSSCDVRPFLPRPPFQHKHPVIMELREQPQK